MGMVPLVMMVIFIRLIYVVDHAGERGIDLSRLRCVLELVLTAGAWCMPCMMLCTGVLGVPFEAVRCLMGSGYLLQRVFAFCIMWSMAMFFLSLMVLLEAYAVEAGERGSAEDLLLRLCGSLLDALARPLGFVTLLWGMVADDSDGGGRASVGRDELVGAMLGLAFLTFLACGMLSITVV